jgi:uncharacterized lipoprotein YmbA
MTKRAAILGLTLLVSGCGFLSSKPSKFYTLDKIAPEGAVASRSGLPIAIDVIELPPGLDRREVIVRKADQQLEIRGREQWSATLEPLVLHTLAFDLAARLPEGMVILPGQPVPVGAKRSIDVVFEELAAGPGNSIALDARWTLHDGNVATTQHEQINVDIASLDSATIASGTSRAIATLADHIVEKLPSR